MLSIIFTGLFIGFLSSAPMGPVGMLCVQRTLTEGRRNGLFTGLGAVAGDLIIAIIALSITFGIGLSADFLEEHETHLKIIGSVVLIIFGLITYRKNPSKNIRKLDENKMSEWKILVSSMLLTISNIATLFLYIGLFARFNVVDVDSPLRTFISILFLGIGAFLWWLLITYFVNKLRKVFNPRGLQLFNRIIGVVLIVLGVVGLFSGIVDYSTLLSLKSTLTP